MGSCHISVGLNKMNHETKYHSANYGSSEIIGGLSKKSGNSKQKESGVFHTSRISSKQLNFRIERFSKCVCISIIKKVKNVV